MPSPPGSRLARPGSGTTTCLMVPVPAARSRTHGGSPERTGPDALASSLRIVRGSAHAVSRCTEVKAGTKSVPAHVMTGKTTAEPSVTG